MSKFSNPVVLKLIEKHRRLWAIRHASALMSWDTETYMPRAGIDGRSYASAELEALYQQAITAPDVVALLEAAEGFEGLNDYERGVIRVMRREVDRYTKIPAQLLYRLERTSGLAFEAWREAREKSEFSKFSPYLKELVEINRKIAEALGYREEPYDALLDLHEEGLTTGEASRVLEGIRGELKRIYERVSADGYYIRPSALEEASYDTGAMGQVNRAVLEMLGYPADRARLDVSPHPFTIELGIDDVRITTRYEGRDFKRSLFSVIHEFGHATYALQIDRELFMTPIGDGVSLGIHEGQSRFWENVIGRSREFATLVKPLLDEKLKLTRGTDVEELYRYFALVKPQPVRTEADELTYNLHIILRFELEKGMIRGEVKVDELPELWNRMSEELLGIRPRNDAEGVLQDIHWAHGSIGYFPTYTLGNIVAAMMWSAIGKERVKELVAGSRFGEIKEFMKERVHIYGATYQPRELLMKSFGSSYSPDALISYLSAKYLS